MKKTLKRPNYAEELLKIIQSPLKNEVLLDRLNDYHERDIADALELLSPQQRKKLYPVLGAERLAEIFSYLETPTQYLSELSINQAAKMHFMFAGKVSVPMVIRTAAGGGTGAAAQHSQSLEQMYLHVPGLKVVVPSTPYDAKGLLKQAIRDNNPVIFLEQKKLYNVKGMVPDEDYTIPFGVADVKREGTDVSIFTYGRMVQMSLDVAEKLAEEGINVEVVDLRTLSPLDTNTIIESVKKTHKAVIVHESVQFGGFGGEVAAQITDSEAFYYLDAPIKRVGALYCPVPFNPTLEAETFPTPAKIEAAVRDVL